jgi:hypothetical protein
MGLDPSFIFPILFEQEGNSTYVISLLINIFLFRYLFPIYIN